MQTSLFRGWESTNVIIIILLYNGIQFMSLVPNIPLNAYLVDISNTFTMINTIAAMVLL